MGDEQKLFGWEALNDMEFGDNWAELCKIKKSCTSYVYFAGFRYN